MTDPLRAKLTEADRRIVWETLNQVEENLVVGPGGLYRLGCPSAILGAVLLVGWPRLRDAVPGGDFVSPFVLLAGVLLLLAPPLALFLARRGGGASAMAVEAALRRLEDPESDRETALRASALLVAHAFTGEGPTTVRTLDPAEVRERTGARMPLLLAVEEWLVAEGLSRPIFEEDQGDLAKDDA